MKQFVKEVFRTKNHSFHMFIVICIVNSAFTSLREAPSCLSRLSPLSSPIHPDPKLKHQIKLRFDWLLKIFHSFFKFISSISTSLFNYNIEIPFQ